MLDRRAASVAEALKDVRDGSVVLVGGFGAVGHPIALLDGLVEQGARDLTIVANNSGIGQGALPRLMALGRVRRIICSFPRTSEIFADLYRQGKLELEVVPQGTLAERLRAAGAGIPAFYTPTSVGTLLAEGKEVRTFHGRQYVLEHALHGDVALIEGWHGDRWGNLTYNQSGRNFNPVMAMAATTTIAQVQHLVELGGIPPESVVTPGIFVQRVVHVSTGGVPADG
jgi:3-oxoadipate CoA-transferase alpha subunit